MSVFLYLFILNEFILISSTLILHHRTHSSLPNTYLFVISSFNREKNSTQLYNLLNLFNPSIAISSLSITPMKNKSANQSVFNANISAFLSSALQYQLNMTEDEMVRWHHRLDGHEFEQGPGVGGGQGSLVCCSPWVTKGRTRLSNWTDQLKVHSLKFLNQLLLPPTSFTEVMMKLLHIFSQSVFHPEILPTLWLNFYKGCI